MPHIFDPLDIVPTGDARDDGPTVCHCPGPPTRLHHWIAGGDECARCRRLIWAPERGVA
jgi:hypothetical protein